MAASGVARESGVSNKYHSEDEEREWENKDGRIQGRDRLRAGARPASFNGGCDAAAGTEFSAHDSPDRIAGFNDVFKDLVDDVFLKDAEVSVTEEVLLERFQFEAALTRHVANGEDAEVRKPGFWADRSHLRVVDEDFIAGKLILPGLDRGKCEIEAGFGVVVGVAGFRCHSSIVRVTMQMANAAQMSIFPLLRDGLTTLIYWHRLRKWL
jgi:hypothetical protein